MAQAPVEEISQMINSINFFNNKAKALKSCAISLVEEFNGEVPRTVEELSSLAGVGRKTANVVLGNAFNINTGIVVDTHVKRTTNLLGLSKESDPVKIEKELMKLFPNETWTEISHLLIFLGRRMCIARRPQCDLCVLKDLCPASKNMMRAAGKASRGTK